jgi:K+-transporting ATPase ATPase A chain
MNAPDLLQLLFYAAALLVLCPLAGRYLHAMLSPDRGGALALPERLVYGACGVDAQREQNWSEYARALLAVNGAGIALLFAILKFQNLLPLNPGGLPGLSWHLALNTAISFVTNTNWQSYGGESTMSMFSQAFGLTVQNFLSPATGIAVVLALVRGLVRRETSSVGNFYVDMTRAVLYVLLPLSIVFALLLVWQGVPQNLVASVSASTLEGAQQTLVQGPVASQEAIKILGTNGGGYYNVNSAHPYENPTPLSNALQMLGILGLAGGLVFLFGRMASDRRQAWALFAAMLIPLMLAIGAGYWAESQGNPFAVASGVDPALANMEGKEVRFGTLSSVIYAVFTTAASCGAVNAMHDSFTALGGLVPMVMIQLGEVIFGGVGSGLYGMLVFALLTVFIAGLMVGRTPEYLGKKIEAREMKLAVFAALMPMPLGILVLGAFAITLPVGVAGLANPGPHGLSEMLYAYTSATGNNGSAFAGLMANTAFHDTLLGIAMLIGRFGPIVPILAIAGSLAAKKRIPPSAGTFPTHGAIFVALLIGVILIVGALTYFPTLALGPVAEHFSTLAGQQF